MKLSEEGQHVDLCGGQGQNRTGPRRGRQVGSSANYQPVLDSMRVGSFIGGQGQNRTADTGIFSPLLYRLSYLAIGGISENAY